LLLEALQRRGAPLPVKKPIAELIRLAAVIGERFSGPKM